MSAQQRKIDQTRAYGLSDQRQTKLSRLEIERLLKQALAEDKGKKGDITVKALFPKNFSINGKVIAKSSGVICGLDIARMVFQILSPLIKVEQLVQEGERVKPGQIVAKIEGPVREVLIGERTALNFLQRLSGIATITRKFVQSAGQAKILDTRKTTPNLRILEKYAVRIGGGINHRFGPSDLILIKDNHLAALQKTKKISKIQAIRLAISLARKKVGTKQLIEVEITNWQEAMVAYQAGADILMFDNASSEEVRKFVANLGKDRKKVILEWSGGINLEKIRRIRPLLVDWISVGKLTHSAPALDFSLKILPK
ncbi:MAG: carboxylating nicotinate-nucleotide diphosphorylase [Candidatus Omnitrophica bacterium]|nr:carboxylating nicotinate-nucleotide diphosphorylase [Candidatus Omnitrophota bacterium]